MRNLILLCCALPLALQAQDEQPKRWTHKTDLSFVSTGGNTENQTIGFSNLSKYVKGKSTFALKLSAHEIETTRFVRQAVGSLDDFQVQEDKFTDKTAENYQLGLKYDYKLTDKFYWFAAGLWKKDIPAGIDQSTSTSAGVGYHWATSDKLKFSTDVGAQLTEEEPVFEPEGFDGGFLEVRFGYDLAYKATPTTTFTQGLLGGWNTEESEDYKAELQSKLEVAISQRLALTVGLKLNYDNEPGFISLDLFSPEDVPLGQVPFQQDDLDTVFTTSLTVNW